MTRTLCTFCAVIGVTLGLLVMGMVLGGLWAAAALITITLVIAALDEFTAFDLPASESAPWAQALSTGLGYIHFAVLAAVPAVIVLADHSLLADLALFAAGGLYLGQVSNANAHELIHAPDRFRRALGRWNYISLLYGHHATAHPGVHHVHVATPLDPNSARLNEGFWKFLPRCWVGAFKAGLALEQNRQRARGRTAWDRRNPYWHYMVGGLGVTLMMLGALGLLGLGIFFLLCAFTQSQLILSDYVQHYGLRRLKRLDGSYEPLGPEHAWDAPHWASSALMLNATRHADHHLHPSRSFEALELPAGSPRLPHPLPVMAVIALWPNLWRQTMAPRAEAAMVKYA